MTKCKNCKYELKFCPDHEESSFGQLKHIFDFTKDFGFSSGCTNPEPISEEEQHVREFNNKWIREPEVQ